MSSKKVVIKNKRRIDFWAHRIATTIISSGYSRIKIKSTVTIIITKYCLRFIRQDPASKCVILDICNNGLVLSFEYYLIFSWLYLLYIPIS